MKKNDKKVRAAIRKEVGYRDSRIKTGTVIEDRRTKSRKRSAVKQETRREVKECLG